MSRTLNHPLYTREQFRKMALRQIELERLMDEAFEYCHPGDDYPLGLYNEWLRLEYLVNA